MILCLLLFIGFLRYVIPVVVKGDSMVPNLMENQRLFVLKNRQLDRFDIIVFREEETNKPLIKRVIGLPGETIRYENDILYVDG
ncbi:MAG: signal peptidase I, partial [Enterococcus aquimarinus]